jgi:alkylated DNA repair dioxygenase AlkB
MSSGGRVEKVDLDSQNLHVSHFHQFLNPEEEKFWYDKILELVPWYRVKYKSARFQNQCVTPCWTNFYGGYKDLRPYCDVPAFLKPLVEKVSKATNAKYNSILIRLYYDGNDNIAWHTDGRTFLGKTPTIGSLSLGYKATFEMRRMTNVWPCAKGDNGIDTRAEQREFTCRGGDLLVMRGDTQDHWHHRVPQEKYRRPRVNINFRNILPNREDTQRGQHSYYKYMVHGDEASPVPKMYSEISKERSSILSFVQKPSTPKPNGGKTKKRKLQGGPVLSESRPNGNEQKTKGTRTWTCSTCTLINDRRVTICGACGQFEANTKRANNTKPTGRSREQKLLSSFLKGIK